MRKTIPEIENWAYLSRFLDCFSRYSELILILGKSANQVVKTFKDRVIILYTTEVLCLWFPSSSQPSLLPLDPLYPSLVPPQPSLPITGTPSTLTAVPAGCGYGRRTSLLPRTFLPGLGPSPLSWTTWPLVQVGESPDDTFPLPSLINCCFPPPLILGCLTLRLTADYYTPRIMVICSAWCKLQN